MAHKISNVELNRALHAALLPLGFKKSSFQTCCAQLTADIFGWVGFNHAKMPDGAVEVGPMLGIHFTKVHQFIAQLRGERYHRCNPPTFVQNAGYLMPERGTYIAIRFERQEHVNERVQLFANIVSQVGLPFMRSHSDLSSALGSLEHFGAPSGYEERLCAAYYLLGDYERARLAAEERLRVLHGEHPVLLADFEKFCGPFLKLLAS